MFSRTAFIAALLVAVPFGALAYDDILPGVWYDEAVEAFARDGYLDITQSKFRPDDTSTRAEYIKLIVELNGGVLSTPPAVPSFDDVPVDAWFYVYMEEAAREGWVKGDGNCYGTHPCMAHPNDSITRAEVAVIAARAFGIEGSGDAPRFVDLDPAAWYADSIQALADHCLLEGEPTPGTARPLDRINRAEMVVLLHRIDQYQAYGTTCEMMIDHFEPQIDDVIQTSWETVEVEFATEIDADTALDVSHYTLRDRGEWVDIVSAIALTEDTVELTTKAPFGSCGETLALTVEALKTIDGAVFSDSMGFLGACAEAR